MLPCRAGCSELRQCAAATSLSWQLQLPSNPFGPQSSNLPGPGECMRSRRECPREWLPPAQAQASRPQRRRQQQAWPRGSWSPLSAWKQIRVGRWPPEAPPAPKLQQASSSPVRMATFIDTCRVVWQKPDGCGREGCNRRRQVTGARTGTGVVGEHDERRAGFQGSPRHAVFRCSPTFSRSAARARSASCAVTWNLVKHPADPTRLVLVGSMVAVLAVRQYQLSLGCRLWCVSPAASAVIVIQKQRFDLTMPGAVCEGR
jgi:hypothetical protein